MESGFEENSVLEMSLLPSKSLGVRPVSGLHRKRPDHLEEARLENSKFEDSYLRKALQPVSNKAREILQRSALHGFPKHLLKGHYLAAETHVDSFHRSELGILRVHSVYHHQFVPIVSQSNAHFQIK